jgi:F0F1-type ATP synthase assembly protein I
MLSRSTKKSGEALRAVGALSTVGLSFVLALAIGFWIGDRLDKWLNTSPVMALVGFFLGLAAGVLNVFRTVSRAFPTGTARPPKGSVDNRPSASSPAAEAVDDDGPADT